MPPVEQACAAAQGKADDVAGRRPGAWVVGVDTVVCIGEEVFGQPEDGFDAARMLRALSGRVHSVISGVCVVAPGSRRACDHALSKVEMAKLSRLRISQYIATGEAMGKAGAYAIQGEAAGFCTLVDGSLDNVIGLPLDVLWGLLRRLDFRDAPLW